MSEVTIRRSGNQWYVLLNRYNAPNLVHESRELLSSDNPYALNDDVRAWLYDCTPIPATWRALDGISVVIGFVCEDTLLAFKMRWL